MSIFRSLQTILIFLLFYFIYSFFIYTQEAESIAANKIITPLAYEGRLVFQKYNCISCHQLYGLGGYLGTDLTNVISKKGAYYVSAVIKNGMLKMPNLNVEDKEIIALIEFLSFVDSSGVSPVIEFETEWYGIITPKTKK
ncbi:MAG: cytochrome c [Flavobacteriales bacterium]|jgi:nitric oxide reductase subunit C|nr:cytochrome c [Flavobacteriales bacterium]